MCILLLFRNQCIKLPGGGIRFGYFFVLCLAAASADNWGPGYLGGSLRSREPWDGGLNLVGFSRMRGLELLEGGLVTFEACRIVREVDDGIGRRVLHITPRWGSKNRGIEVVKDIVFYNAVIPKFLF
jgi:hypothetical protein